ncbi:MAG: holin family protein [Desulfobacterales bacterium]
MDLTGIGSVADFAKSIVDRIFPPSADPNERMKAQAEMERMLAERENVLVQAKAAVMTSELTQDDSYTKRGRPTIIYAGLVFIFLVHVLFPIIAWAVLMFKGSGAAMPSLALPSEFWMAWGGCCSLYILGRSKEKSSGELGGIFGKIYDVVGGKNNG